MSKDYEEAIRMVGDLIIGITELKTTWNKNCHSALLSFMKTPFLRTLLNPSPLLQGSTNVRVGSSIFGARSYPPPPPAASSKGVENSGGVVGGGRPAIEANPSANTQNIAAWNIYVCANQGWISHPTFLKTQHTHFHTVHAHSVSHNGMSRCIPQKFLFSACVGMRSKIKKHIFSPK